MTIGERFAAGPNGFDAIRLGAALLVLWSHAFVIAGQAAGEPLAPLLGRLADGGALGVAAFFALSGFLIARSAERRGAGAFLLARVRRIGPAYWVLVVLQVLGLGAAVSTLGAGAYLRDPAVWGALGRALLFSPRAGLPGVWEGHPLPGVVNGSLWTLRIEVLCYAGALAWRFVPGRRVLALLGAAALVAGVGVAPRFGVPFAVLAIGDCLAAFAVGVALWAWRDVVPCSRGVAAALVLVAVGMAHAGVPAAAAVWAAAVPYAVIVGGLWLRGWGFGDVSYGAYLYAFPVEQLVAGALPGAGGWAVAGLALPGTLLCAAVSRVLVERPALAWGMDAARGGC